MNKQEIKALLAGTLAGICILLVIFLAAYRVTDVKVEGNLKYSDEEIKRMVLQGPMGHNTILSRFIDTKSKIREQDFIYNIKIKKTGNHSLKILVREKELCGYVEFLKDKFYFDREGVVQLTSQDKIDGVYKVEGLSVSELRVGDKVPGLSREVLEMLNVVEEIIRESDLKPDRIQLDRGSELIIYYDDLEVRVGTGKHISEKMGKLMGILPNLKGKKGILYLQNVDSSSKGIIFENRPEEELEEEVTEETEEETEEETTEETEEEITEEGSEGEIQEEQLEES